VFFSEIYQMKPKKDKLHKMTVGKQREQQVEQGFFDGRFVQRVEESKKTYKRKEKHPKKDV
jgi:hypothetical protein